jgi:hypothetical protein
MVPIISPVLTRLAHRAIGARGSFEELAVAAQTEIADQGDIGREEEMGAQCRVFSDEAELGKRID